MKPCRHHFLGSASPFCRAQVSASNFVSVLTFIEQRAHRWQFDGANGLSPAILTSVRHSAVLVSYI